MPSTKAGISLGISVNLIVIAFFISSLLKAKIFSISLSIPLKIYFHSFYKLSDSCLLGSISSNNKISSSNASSTASTNKLSLIISSQISISLYIILSLSINGVPLYQLLIFSFLLSLLLEHLLIIP